MLHPYDPRHSRQRRAYGLNGIEQRQSWVACRADKYQRAVNPVGQDLSVDQSD